MQNALLLFAAVGLVAAYKKEIPIDGNIPLELEFDGHLRIAILHLPPEKENESCDAEGSCSSEKFPLVIDLHPLGYNAKMQQDQTGFSKLADEKGFVTVHPQGIVPAMSEDSEGKDAFSWNAGGCCPGATLKKIDDIGFLRKLLTYISSDKANEYGFQIDATRVYATGMSNGGFLSHRIGCEMADVIAAVAPVAAVLFTNPPPVAGDPFVCEPRNAKGERVEVPVLHIHGTQDSLVPYKGGVPHPTLAEKFLFGEFFFKKLAKAMAPGHVDMEFPSVEDSLNHWLRLNGEVHAYDGPVKDETIKAEGVVCQSYTGTKTVTLCTLDDGHGHQWPSTPLIQHGFPTCPTDEYIELLKPVKKILFIEGLKHLTRLGLGCSTTFNATQYIWNFFEKNHL